MKLKRLVLLAPALLTAALPAVAQPAVVLEDGGIQFPDGSVQETSAAVPAGPPTATVNVDCAAGDSIVEALKTPADVLTIQISGMCHEIVVTSRPRVIFRGTDPMTDGIDATGTPGVPLNNPLNLLGAYVVDVENLKLTGGAGGLGIDWSFAIDVVNSRLEGNSFTGAFVGIGSARVRFTDTVVTGNGSRGLEVSTGSSVSCTRCTIDENGDSGLGTGIFCFEGSTVSLTDSTVEGKRAINALGCAIRATGGTLEAKPDGTFGLAIQASEQATVDLSGTSVVGAMWAQTGTNAEWNNVTQTAAVGTDPTNSLSGGSTLVATGTTSLIGGLGVEEFSNAVIDTDASLAGDLLCGSGGDAFCAEPADVSGTSSCAQCPKP